MVKQNITQTNKCSEGGQLQNKIKKALPVILLLLLITVIIGVTYAVYNLTKIGKENTITTGLVSMSYTESTNVISIKDALPKSDAEGITQSEYFDFSVTSNLTLKENESVPVNYSIELETLNVDTGYTSLSDDQIKIYLENTDTNKVIKNDLISNLEGSTIKTLYTTYHKHEYGTNTITTNYRLRTWVDYNVDASNWNSTNKYEYKFRINVNGDIDYVGAGSLQGEIAKQVQTKAISYQYINDAKQTINGITYNDGDNGVFLFDGTDDNGGTYPIYYYRGNVTNNNVLFGGFCWKIVRTTSTRGTKLIYNGTPSNGKCNATGEDTQIGTSSFNNNYGSPADVGYMYGTRYTYSSKNMSSITDTYMYGNDVTYSNGTYTLSGKTITSSSWSTDRTTLANGYHYTCLNSTGTCTSVYYIVDFISDKYMYYLTFTGGDTLDTAKNKMFTNTNDSTIKTYIDNWYKTNLIDYTSYLENTIFCNDRSLSSTYGGPLGSKNTNNTNDGSHFFGGYERLGYTYSPSLVCQNQNDKFSLSATNGGTSGYGNNTLIYPVGLLTYDEAMLAGGQNTYNSNYYLYGNYWLLSPSSYQGERVGYVSPYSVTNEEIYWLFGVRPSVSLQPGTLFLEGDGTAETPYVVTKE